MALNSYLLLKLSALVINNFKFSYKISKQSSNETISKLLL